MSASMRMLMQMVEQREDPSSRESRKNQIEEMNRNNTLEINPNHPLVTKLNQLRKKDPKKASLIAKQMMDSVLAFSGVPYNLQDSTKRNLDIMNDYLNIVTRKWGVINEWFVWRMLT